MDGLRGIAGPPRDHIEGTWPNGTSDDPAVLAAQVIAQRVLVAMGAQSARAFARVVELDHTTVSGLVTGKFWPDFITIVRLSTRLDLDLWPDPRQLVPPRSEQ